MTEEEIPTNRPQKLFCGLTEAYFDRLSQEATSVFWRTKPVLAVNDAAQLSGKTGSPPCIVVANYEGEIFFLHQLGFYSCCELGKIKELETYTGKDTESFAKKYSRTRSGEKWKLRLLRNAGKEADNYAHA